MTMTITETLDRVDELQESLNTFADEVLTAIGNRRYCDTCFLNLFDRSGVSYVRVIGEFRGEFVNSVEVLLTVAESWFALKDVAARRAVMNTYAIAQRTACEARETQERVKQAAAVEAKERELLAELQKKYPS